MYISTLPAGMHTMCVPDIVEAMKETSSWR